MRQAGFEPAAFDYASAQTSRLVLKVDVVNYTEMLRSTLDRAEREASRPYAAIDELKRAVPMR